MKQFSIEIYRGDITILEVDAIVNAANNTLLGGGGVDGAIHKAAGPELLEECKKLRGCATGDAKITKGYNLNAKHVIHTVGPVWYGGLKNENEILAQCYINSLKLTKEYKIKSIAFPNISTGVYKFPKEKAAKIAVNEVNQYMKENHTLEKLIFAIFDEENFEIYQKLLF